MKDLIVLASMRTGHHAIINWLGYQIPYKVIHYNHCVNGWDKNQLLPHHSRYNKTYNGDLTKTISIYSIEDFQPSILWNKSLKNFYSPEHHQLVVVTRDPLNWLASSLESPVPYIRDGLEKSNNLLGTKIKVSERILIYKELYHWSRKDIYYIDFNRWTSSKEYRRQICIDLDLVFTDDGKEEVPWFGGGSSFDGMELKNNASQQDVLNRYKKVSNNPLYQKLVKIHNLNKLQELYFERNN